MDANISKLKLLGTRLIAGVLTASMLLSTVTTAVAAGIGASTAPDSVVEEDPNKGNIDNSNTDYEGDQTPEEEPKYSYPLVLDRYSIGFTPEQTTVRVQATVTDVRYLGALESLEEFASFFPADLDLDACEYLTEDLRQGIAQMDEDTRRSYRGEAIGKLRVTKQFVWSTIFEGYDYKDYIEIEVVDYSVRDASESMAPSISCNVNITWVGPTETVAAVRPTGGQGGGMTTLDPGSSDIQDLIGAAGSNAGSSTTKNVADEPQAIQDFLYEMYKSGGLTQENAGGYDLSYFDERLKAEGVTPGSGSMSNTTDVDLDALLNGQQTDGAQVQDTGFSLITSSDDTINNKVDGKTAETEKEEAGAEAEDSTPKQPEDDAAEPAEPAADEESKETVENTGLELNDTVPEPDPVLDEKVEPPLEETAVPLDAPGDAELAEELPEGGEQNKENDSQAGDDQAGDQAISDTKTPDDEKISSEETEKEESKNEETGDQSKGELTMEEILAQLGAGSGTAASKQEIVTQTGGVTSSFNNFEWKLTKDEEKLYGEDSVVQTAVVEPSIDSSGSVMYEVKFAVSVPSMEMSVDGTAYFFGTATVPELPGDDNTQTDVDDPKKDDDGEQKEDPADKPGEEKPDDGETPADDPNNNDVQGSYASVKDTDPTDSELAAYFNLRDQGPADKVYHVRTFLGAQGQSTTYDVSGYLKTVLEDSNWDGDTSTVLYSVLDPRVAEINGTGIVTTKREGRTAVYAMGYDDYSGKVYAVLQLEVHGRFTLSSGEAITGNAGDGYSAKLAVPMVSAGNLHSLALKADGSVWGWGSASNTNALGSANGGVLRSPAPIYLRSSNGIYTPLTGVVMVSAGLNFSLALTANGNVYAWGSNTRGQTGTGDISGRDTVQDPTMVRGPVTAEGAPADPNTDANGHLCNIVAIAAGGNHAMALAADGTVYAWGDGSYGQLGVKAEDLTYSEAGKFYYSGYPVVVKDGNGDALTGIVSIAAGGSISVALSAAGKVYTWGDNRRGQLGLNHNPSDGKDNEWFQQSAAGEVNAYKTRNGSEWNENTGFGGVVAVDAGGAASNDEHGYGHMMAIAAELNMVDGVRTDTTTVFGWGQNDRGQVGDNSPQPDSKDEENTYAILPTEVTYRDSNEYDIRTVTVSAGVDHTLSVVRERPKGSDDSRDDVYYTYGWGYDTRGQLGQSSDSGQVSSDGSGTNTSSQKRTPTKMLSENFTRDEDGNINSGELKYVTGSVGVSAGDNFSILWDEAGEVFGTGYNFVYQLGAAPTLRTMVDSKGNPMADNASVAVPVRVGYGVSQNLIYDKVWVFTTMTDEDTGETTTQLTARYAVQPETVPVQGEEGDADIAPNVASIPVSKLTQMDPTENDENLMDLNEEQFNALKAVSLQYSITLTDQQYAVVFKDGMKRYYSVGFNISERDRAVPSAKDSEMIYGYTHTEEIPNLDITDTKDHQEPWEKLSRNNAVLEPTDLKDVFTIVGIVEDAADVDINGVYAGKLKVIIEDANNFATPMIRTGENFTVALKSDGTVWAWGDNTYGQLGTGKSYDELPYAPYPMRVTGLGTRESKPVMSRLTLIKEISAGFNHALARTADGSVYAWGDNSRGQLGQNENVYSTYEVHGDTIKVEVDKAAVEKLKDTWSCYPIQVTAGASGDESGSSYLMGATSIAAGGYHSMASVGETGWVYTWGDNSKAQLGTGYKVNAIGDIRTYPDRVVRDVNGETPEMKYLTAVTEVAGGGWHSLAIGPFPYANVGGTSGSDSTYVAAWGDNTYGQLGIGPHETDEDGTRYGVAVDYMRQYSNTGEGAGILVDSVIQIGAGFYHTAVLTEGDSTRGTGGRVMLAGDYRYGQLGHAASADQTGLGYVQYATALVDDKGIDITDAVGVAAGQYHTAILRGKRAVLPDPTILGPIIESTIYTFGTNTDGQLALPATDSNGYYQDQTVDENYRIVTKPGNVAGVVTSLAAGGKHTVALTDRGEVFAWGKNESGQLGEMSLVDRDSAGQSGFDDAYIPVVSGVVNYGGNFTYPVRMETHQNGALWNRVPDAAYNDCDYKLVQNTPVKREYPLVRTVEGAAYVNEAGEAVPYYTHYDAADVVGGSYNIWSREQKPGAMWKDTGAEVKVGKGVDFTKTPAVIDFFTITFSLAETGGNSSTSSSITGEYTVGGETSVVTSGDSVWGGGKLVLHVTGRGGYVSDYNYEWVVDPAATVYTTERKDRWTVYDGKWTDSEGVEHTGGYTDGENFKDELTQSEAATVDGYFTVDSLSDQVNVECTVEHPRLFDLDVRVNLDHSPWTDSDRKLFIKSNYKTILLEKQDGKNTYTAKDVPEGTYKVWEYVDGAFEGGLLTHPEFAFEGPKTITVKNSNKTDTLDYFTLNASIVPVNGVAMAELSIHYAQYSQVDGEDRYSVYTGGSTGNATWKLIDGDKVMADAPLIITTVTTALTSGVVGSRVRSAWRNSNGGTVNIGLEKIEYQYSTTDGTTPLQIMKVVGETDLVVTMDGNVAGDENYMIPMAIRLTKNNVNWTDATAQGYELYLESLRGRTTMVGAPQRVWASYKLTHRGGGLFDTSELGGTERGGIPRDDYMVYLRYPDGTKLPVMGSQFNLTYRGYVKDTLQGAIDPAEQPLSVPVREIEYTLMAANDDGAAMTSTLTQGHVQIISGFNGAINDTEADIYSGKTSDGLIVAMPDEQAPAYNVTVLRTIDVAAKKGAAGNVSGKLVIPVNNTISVQVIGSHADEFVVRVLQTFEDPDDEVELDVGGIPLGKPLTFSTDDTINENIDDADNKPWDLATAKAITIRVVGSGESVITGGGSYGDATLSSLDDELTVTDDALLTGYNVVYTMQRPHTEAGVELMEASGGSTTLPEGGVLDAEVVVPDRELANWSGKEVKLPDLALGNYLELVTGDTVDIVGTSERYIPDYRLAYTKGGEKYYRNVTTDADGKVQPYIDLPAEEIVVGKDESGRDITEKILSAMSKWAYRKMKRATRSLFTRTSGLTHSLKSLPPTPTWWM